VFICNIPSFSKINTVAVIYYFNNSINKITANYDKNSKVWTIPKLPQNDYYFYLINDKFPIPDANTNRFYEIQNNIFTTVDRNEQAYTQLYKVKSQICSKLDKNNNPVNTQTIFSLQDPLVIVSLDIKSEFKKTLVINIEWIYENEPFWITAKPYIVNKSLKTFNCLKIDNNIKFGNWACNIYLGTYFAKQHNFKIVENDNTTVIPNAAFVNVKI